MYIGAHISAAGGVFNAPLNATKHNCECYQFFSRSPRGGPAPKLTAEILKQFKVNNQQNNFTHFYIHAPYYINLASPVDKIYSNSISILKEELQRGTALGAKAMMFHIGSFKNISRSKAIQRVAKGLKQIIYNYAGSCQPLLEISAGSGQIIGSTFEEITKIIDSTETKKTKNTLGVCFDTAHAFASGYDLRNKKAIEQTFNTFNKTIGLKRLTVIHANDSKVDFNSHRDRHDHIGKGKIGKDGFVALINYFKKYKPSIDFIMETPTDKGVTQDIKILKQLRNKK